MKGQHVPIPVRKHVLITNGIQKISYKEKLVTISTIRLNMWNMVNCIIQEIEAEKVHVILIRKATG